ncbi:MAG: peptidase domain-containing ABC transporter [Saprospiraceae bacterium]
MTLTPVKRFWNLLRPFNREIRQIYAYALFIGIVNLTLPLGIQAIINFLQTGELTSTWVILVGFVLIGITITGVLQVLQLRIVENIQQNLFARSGFEFAYRIPKISFLQLDKVHAPELVNRFFDTLTIQKGLPKILIDFSSATFQIIFGLILLTIYSVYFIILGVALSLVLWLIFQVTDPKGLSTSLVESKYKYRLAHWLEEVARVNRSLKIYSRNRFHLNRTDEIVEGYLKSRETHFGVLINQFKLFIGFKVLLAAGLLLLGGFLVFNNLMNIGQFVAAEIVILLIINSVEKVLRTIDTIYDVLTALDKIGYVTDLQLDKGTGIAELNTPGGVSLEAKEITFGFPDERKNIFNDLSFKIDAGEKVVLQGKSGTGKSLLLQLLAGIHQIEDGDFYVNDIPFANYQRDSFYGQLGMSFPVNQIFEGTFRENILMGRDIPNEELMGIIKLLDLEEYLAHRPQHIDCYVDSGGRRLPRSIIQKLQIARIIINKPKLLLMEDPLQFIQEDEKKRIIDYIMDEEREWTVLVVSDFYYWGERSGRIIRLGEKKGG